jgi:hypothetical protein
MGFFSIILWITIIYVVVRLLRSSEPIGNWSHLFPDMQIDPEEFYKLVEDILTEWKIPNVKTGRRTLKQGGVLSHQRVYLEIECGDYVYHVCAAPWGTGFFFSWWLRQSTNDAFERMITKIPFIGPAIAQIMNQSTYYKLDTDAMLKTSIQQSIMTAVERITKAQGIRELTETERKPDLRSAFK